MQPKKQIPEFPKFCRQCNGKLDCLPYSNSDDAWVDDEGRSCKIIAHDIFTGEPRTFEYTLACRNCLGHTQLKVLETPSLGWRAVIRADRYDEKRARH